MKRRKNEQTDGSDYEGSTDRLSDLPESLIVQILSLLPIEEAVRTGVLCTRWKHLWKHVNKVVLEYLVYHLPPEEQTNFISFIDHTLMQCVCAKTISLYSVIALDEVNSHSLHNLFDRLIQQFYSQKVESLKVRFERFNYAPPEWFYHNSTMVKLDISNWTLLALPAVVSWNFLRSLSLGALAIGDEQFAKILSGCPVLVDLDLLDIRSTNNNIKIMSQSLLKLSVSYEWFHEQDEVLLEINAPRLQFLRFFGGFYNVDVCFVNVSSLVHANLNYDTDDDMRIYLAIELLKSLHHVPELTIGEDFISALSFLKLSGQPCPLLNWKRVTFIISVFKEELLGLTHLLKNSCSLETLSIEFRKYEKDECRYDIEEMYDFEASTYLSVESGDFPHLKSIEVTYCYCENDLGEEDRATFVFEFVAYILRQAHVLEKLVIAPQEECCKCSRNCPLIYTKQRNRLEHKRMF